MDDDRSYLEKTLSFSETRHGQENTPAELVAEFAKFDEYDRTVRLEAIKTDMQAEHLSIDEAAKLHLYQSALLNAHARMRKAGR